jgi:ubiquinone/menaquinone biosynthesis C-methylase UbiE/uncharacterized protein YbaR (Trm112 family)
MNVDNLLACPTCSKSSLSKSHENYTCESCEVQYPFRDDVPVFLRPNSKVVAEESDRAEFWNAGWEKRNKHLLEKDSEEILKERLEYLDYLATSGYPSAIDISPENVANKTFLNIGCGGGYEGLLFSGYGARYIGIDFSHNAAKFTRTFIQKAGFEGTTFQAEAEALPFQENSIEYIYSSGVLHHTPNTEDSLKEVYRVLKPGGTAMIGLYATYSIMFLWYRLHAILRGNVTKNSIEGWMHANTEGDWQTEDRKNYWTKTYTKAQFTKMMQDAGFGDVKMVQSPLQLKIVPIIGKIIMALFPVWVGDLRIGPIGSMLVATGTKN